MNDPLTIRTERVDDIPLLLAQMQRMDIARLLDAYFPTHGNPEGLSLDSTTASSYGAVSEDGLLQLGYSKDHRPDLLQLKVMLATLDPLGLPLATEVLSGEWADEHRGEDHRELRSIQQRAELGTETLEGEA